MYSKFKKLGQYNLYEVFRYFYEKIFIFFYRFKYNKNRILGDKTNISESDNGFYIRFVGECCVIERKFNKFKRNHIYRQILEHTTYKLSLEYLKKTNQNILNQINKFMINDNTGDPIKFYYKTLNKNVSPGTLRYLKVCSDIEKYFGKKFGNIVEIGCGYGGQYIILDKYFNIQRYTLFDLPQVNKLIEKNLLNYNLKSKYQFGNIKENYKKIDLVISNYAFSELPRKLQKIYLENILSKSNHGYMTMNSGLDMNEILDKQKSKNLSKSYEGHLSLSEIKKFLPNCKVIEETPLTGEGNYILIW